MLGPVADPDLPSLVTAASAFAFSSVKEGFGLAAMEALAAGVPTVVSDLPVLHEVFGDAVTYGAGATDLADKLAESLEADRRRVALGKEVAAAYTWEAAARAHLNLYRGLAKLS